MKLNENVTMTEREISKQLINATAVPVLRVNIAIPVAIQCDEMKLEKNTTTQVGAKMAQISKIPSSARPKTRTLPATCPH